MEFLETSVIVAHILVSLALVVLVLLQQGKGAEAGASFGGGASQTVFGSQGSGNFLTQSTKWLAVVFFATSIGLAYIAKEQAALSVQAATTLVPVDQVEGDAESVSNSEEMLELESQTEDNAAPELE
ncbi:preprotein translocase subunit SecG [Oleiphilus sp. HI0071]|uniref:preprotein translocase subunit SecG n=1 Tax=unclassified Oleiphilus TaxID=2631174 RepID=UPI0007C3E06F|nr:preprotein translocase subunit SecG [Oleiphilus sp. HI0065]KZY77986.1 preprotein translocase subunit SecG [Oleiphilus sp. HI0071]KZY97146.1 preprotein translocase subunit SecG [Oleiphilus sp. HI0073]KZZ11575.1 preprotein translocase subunit SecG [Oleiphilus sp. HI0079]KZZ14494.1 preprotein translocase subunit SecG [Oleiphilus sp. HI0080]KZZ56515.1 preprotein translocase subunit SecG [Oleiphilus sp. HI0122]KZZ79053.1 preprotein translocase subunit SecG [Oleiphilus sp. HI0133]